MGPGGMVSFGHAAYFGLGAYAAGLLLKRAGLPMEAALAAGAARSPALGAVVFGWFCVRLSGVYLAMLTLAFAQIAWSIVFQWDAFTGGRNGMFGVWPSAWLAGKTVYYYLTLVVCVRRHRCCLWRVLFSPFGYALRAGRDSPLRAEAIGIDVRASSGRPSCSPARSPGIAGAALRLLQGQHLARRPWPSPRSVDGLVMVLLGGVADADRAGGRRGASSPGCRTTVARNTDYWRAVLGGVILLLVLLFPQGIVGCAAARWSRRGAARMSACSRSRRCTSPSAACRRCADVSLRASTPASCWR